MEIIWLIVGSSIDFLNYIMIHWRKKASRKYDEDQPFIFLLWTFVMCSWLEYSSAKTNLFFEEIIVNPPVVRLIFTLSTYGLKLNILLTWGYFR